MNYADKLQFLKSLWPRSSERARDELIEDTLFADDWEHFWLVLGGHIFFQTLSAAVRLDLFTLLSKHGGLTRGEISTRLGIEDKPARILLLGCTTLKLLRKDGPTYANAPLAELLLNRRSPRNIISFVELEHHIIYQPMHSFLEAIKAHKNVGLEHYQGDEPTLYQRLAHYPDLEKIFQDAMKDISIQANASFAQFVDLSHVNHLIDVGGGNGENIITLARRYPRLRATVFDSPTVCEIARRNISESGLADRLGVVAGNCFADGLPRGADCYLFAHFFTIWSPEKNRLLLTKVHDVLPPRGSVILFNMMQSDNEDGPYSAALGSPYFLTLATGEGMLYTGREYETWMKEAGFREVSRQKLPKDHEAVIGVRD
jgi:cyclopropane fatty-acyl-phospholipid synthase-like methyltransferase